MSHHGLTAPWYLRVINQAEIHRRDAEDAEQFEALGDNVGRRTHHFSARVGRLSQNTRYDGRQSLALRVLRAFYETSSVKWIS